MQLGLEFGRRQLQHVVGWQWQLGGGGNSRLAGRRFVVAARFADDADGAVGFDNPPAFLTA
jgi:hypothetical protein